MLVIAACAFSAVSDVRTRRIPNVLVATLFAAGLIVNAFAGWQPAAADLALTLILLVAGTVAFSQGVLGGGDVKLLAVSAGVLGYPTAIPLLLYTFLSGGVLAFGYALMRGRLTVTLANVRMMALPMFAGLAPARIREGASIPYALAVFSGALLVFATTAFAPHLRLP